MDKEVLSIFITAGFAILGTIVGGVISSFSPIITDRVKFHREKEHEKLETVYAPLCSSIELPNKNLESIHFFLMR